MNYKLLFTFLFVLSLGTFCYASDGVKVEPVATHLKQRQPNWKFQVVTYHSNGVAKEGVFFEPNANQSVAPIKKVTFDESGKLISEQDLIEQIAENQEDQKKQYVPHGLGVAFYPSGIKECVVSYKEGKLHGPLKAYYPSGKIYNEFCFNENQFCGPALSYYESGQLKEKGFYDNGVAVGAYTNFHENGEKSSEKNFENGVLEGAYMEWYEDGSIKSTRLFQKGELHANGAPAVLLYNEKEKVIESQYFENGQLDGKHIKYHPNSSRSYQVSYVNGKKVGKEEFFSEDGKQLGGGSYKDGKPVKSHNIKYPDGSFQRIAQFSDEGTLLKPAEEFYFSGQLKVRYTLDEDQKFDGHFLEWFEDNQLKLDQYYSNGTLNGLQKEFYPNGEQKCEVSFSDGKQDGLFTQWYEDGQVELKVEIKNGEKDGHFQQWHPDGHLKVSEYYLDGKLHGDSQAWNLEHCLIHKVYYENGLQDGLFQTWFDDGTPYQSITFVKGAKDGLEEVYHLNGQKKSVAHYINGALDEKRLAWFADGHIQLQTEYKNGAPIGKHKEYHSSFENNGEHILKVEAQFEEGKRQGLHQEYHPNGQKHMSINYKDGVFDGRKAMWNDKGDLIEDAHYHDGKLNGKYFVRNGDLSEAIYHYKEDLKDGIHEMHYPPQKGRARKLALKAGYKEDLLEGDVLEYNLNGVLVAQTPFKNGKKEGTTKVFDNEGILRLSIDYSHGEHNGPFKEFSVNGNLIKEIPYEVGQKHGEQNTYSEKGDILSQYRYIQGKLEGYCYNKNKDGVLTFEAEYKGGQRHGKFNKYYDDGRPKVLQSFCDDKLHGTKSIYNAAGELKEIQYRMGEKVK